MTKIGNKIIHLDHVNSTNNFAANLLKSGKIEHGTDILADEQSEGKGQRGAVWQSEGGMNLIFTTFVEYDNLTVDKAVFVNQWISKALIDLLGSLGIDAKVKWPNDIFVVNQKIAGILIENQIINDKLKSSVIGIGLNVNQTQFYGLNATSIKLITHEFCVVKEIAFMLIKIVNDTFKFIENQRFETLNASYHDSLWNLNQLVKYKTNTHIQEGVILGVDPVGNLKMRVNGKTEIFQLKEISFII